MSRRITIALLAVLLVAASAAAVWWWTRAEEPRAASFSGVPTSVVYAPIDSRRSDAAPLTLGEVFGPGTERLAAGPAALVRDAPAEELADCGEVLWGAPADGCTQVMRAAYTSEDGNIAGQFLIFNLADGRAADALVAALAKDAFVRQAASFDPARSRAQARALGHYVTVSWIGPVPGRAATDLARPQIALDTLGAVVQNRVLRAG
ncbi:hypothetical protein [Nonomuraea sp. NPDC046570]|uniref:hypothetical protein n=1 Tax=Nonomuraea sp. NPDC046570 TaxID=3155255 RepID=UPI0033FCCF21